MKPSLGIGLLTALIGYCIGGFIIVVAERVQYHDMGGAFLMLGLYAPVSLFWFAVFAAFARWCTRTLSAITVAAVGAAIACLPLLGAVARGEWQLGFDFPIYMFRLWFAARVFAVELVFLCFVVLLIHCGLWLRTRRSNQALQPTAGRSDV